MPSRVIQARVTSGNNIDISGTEAYRYIEFMTITQDTGPVSGAAITGGSLYLSSYRSYGTNYYLDIIYGGKKDAVVARTDQYAKNDNTHSSTEPLIDFSPTLLTANVSGLTLAVTTVYAPSPDYPKINIRDGCTLTLTIDYELITGCEPPDTVTVDSASVAPGAKVALRWSGARAGSSNPITGYQVYRATDTSGVYELLGTVSTTDPAGSMTVTAPTTNGAVYYYKVRTVGARSGYEGRLSDALATLACNFAATSAPTALRIASTNVAPGEPITLSWSGAMAGENNPITGYQVYRATDAAGVYEWLTSVDTAETYGSATVNAPEQSGAAYYYKVRTMGTLAESDSELSGIFVSLTCTFSSPSAPAQVLIGGAASVYALPGELVTLSWSGASAGANNPVTGYRVYQNGVQYGAELSATTTKCSVPAHDTAGNAHKYTVQTIGTHSDSSESAPVWVYSYTDPTAPTVVSVSNNNPAANARTTLSWSGAEPGGYNAIAGYRVYRSTAVNGEYKLIASLGATAKSQPVYAPNKAGDVYYYRVMTVGTYSLSAYSEAYAAVKAGEDTSEDNASTVIILPQKRKKRGFVFGSYDTAEHGWTLSPGWSFPEPPTQERFLSVPLRIDGPIDQTTTLTNGDPRFGSRSLTATFECSEGTRAERNALISDMVNLLHGQRVTIVLPDDPDRYAVGRVSVNKVYSDLAHASVTVKGTCEPWKYNNAETVVNLLASEAPQVTVLSNSGRRVAVPEITVSGYAAEVVLNCDGHTWTLTAGAHRLPALVLRQGNALLTYSGVGLIELRYREAIL